MNDVKDQSIMEIMGNMKRLSDDILENAHMVSRDYEREQTLFAARTSLENLLTFELSRDARAQITDMITTIEGMK